MKHLRTLALALLVLASGAVGAMLAQPLIAAAAPTNTAAYGNPARLNATPHTRDVARTADDLGIVGMCLFDNTPVSVGDGDANDLRCADATGALAIGTLSGTPLDVNVIEHVGTAGNVNGGNRDAGTQTVTLADDDPAVTDLAAIEVTQDALVVDLAAIEVLQTSIEGDTTSIQTAVEIMDDWDETNRAAVNLVAGQVAVAGGTGVDAANVLRMSLATDIALPAGTNAIGKLAANTGVDIGDVDILSIAAGDNGIGNVDLELAGTAVSADAGAVDGGTVRVVGATASAGTTTAHDPDQTETVPEIAANANRLWVMCVNVGTEPSLIGVGDATGGTAGIPLGGGAAANDGTGGAVTLPTSEGLFIYDINGNGNADTTCVEIET